MVDTSASASSSHQESLKQQQYHELLSTPPASPKSRKGGLVSRRLEMFESPARGGSVTPKASSTPSSPTSTLSPTAPGTGMQRSSAVVPPTTTATTTTTTTAARVATVPAVSQISPSGPPLPPSTTTTTTTTTTPAAAVEESRDEVQSSARASTNNGSEKEGAAEEPADVDAAAGYVGADLITKGVNQYVEGEYDSALKTFKMALKAQRSCVEEDDLSIALTLGNLGAVYLQQNKVQEAHDALSKALEIKRRIAPDMVVADTLNNLGNCANLKGDYDQSLMYYRDALADLRKKGGRRSDIANTLFNIGRLEIQQRHWDNAMSALSMACQLTRELFGGDHVFVAQTLDMIGFVQLCTGQYDSSMVSFSGALVIFRKLYGPLNAAVANSIFNVGMVREAKGELEDAWEAYSTSRDLITRLGTSPDDPGFKVVSHAIAKVEKAIAKKKSITSTSSVSVSASSIPKYAESKKAVASEASMIVSS